MTGSHRDHTMRKPVHVPNYRQQFSQLAGIKHVEVRQIRRVNVVYVKTTSSSVKGELSENFKSG